MSKIQQKTPAVCRGLIFSVEVTFSLSSVWIEGSWFFGYRLGFFRIFGQLVFLFNRILIFGSSWTLLILKVFGFWTLIFGLLDFGLLF